MTLNLYLDTLHLDPYEEYPSAPLQKFPKRQQQRV